MNIGIVSVLLLALCAFQVSTAVKNDLQYNLRELKIRAMEEINTIVNPKLTKIQSDVEQAKRNGKNADHCYTNAKSELRSYSQIAYAELESCVQSNLRNPDEFQALSNARVCNRATVSKMSNEAISVSLEATNCINRL